MNLNLYTVGFSWRKRQILRSFYPQASIHRFTKASQFYNGDTLAIWGRKPLPEGLQTPLSILRVEDGFVRSKGLGAALATPYSWVFDPIGIYYDASAPSALENMLEFEVTSDELISRAEKLRKLLIENNITKYNLDHDTGSKDALLQIRSHISEITKQKTVQKIILVPGQVESDASIQYGCIDLFTNIALLKQVKASNPDAYIIYKPHPDEVSGLRSKSTSSESLSQFCNHIEIRVGIHHLYSICDEVHTLTSLSGFEALIRGLKVYCYGIPFYAGWGLTEDRHSCKRRTRKISLLTLIATSLIRYPQYIHPITKMPSTPEESITQMTLIKKGKALSAPQVKAGALFLAARLRSFVHK